ncbi:hypothetical protein LILAB_00465 [Corallococcus macrosporus]|uniref:Uncharacterized protein n=1 Tax=Myxococcus fulvus (strain ATCC BAA-855 / HW-1) TaxID=483219 RepID=F8C8H9_MYXFH|nr:hypothetical protein LILAB_00465 [Corallococcus macrosporus]
MTATNTAAKLRHGRVAKFPQEQRGRLIQRRFQRRIDGLLHETTRAFIPGADAEERGCPQRFIHVPQRHRIQRACQ